MAVPSAVVFAVFTGCVFAVMQEGGLMRAQDARAGPGAACASDVPPSAAPCRADAGRQPAMALRAWRGGEAGDDLRAEKCRRRRVALFFLHELLLKRTELSLASLLMDLRHTKNDKMGKLNIRV